MKRISLALLIFFIGDCIADVIIAQTGNESARYVTKGLLMPLLLAYFIIETKEAAAATRRKYVWPVSLALVFSLTGDLFLISNRNVNFILGIAAFLTAHIFYIRFFYRVNPFTKGKRLFYWRSGLIISAYVITLNYLFRPLVTLQQLAIPVMAYSVVLGAMVFTAANVTNTTVRPGSFARYIFGGAVIFVISDSLIAFNRFYFKTPLPGFYIMFTYCTGQLLIITGATRFIKRKIIT